MQDISQSLVSFRAEGMNRGGTSVDAKLINNIFYHCEEAAIKMPTKANEAEGNCYVKEEGGYLRILYPQPPVCLHPSCLAGILRL